MSGSIGTVIQANVVHLPSQDARSARSWYLAQVAHIAPPCRLVGRDDELRVIEDFARGAGESNYLVWESEPWAGKTALLSSFVLKQHRGLRVFSFFVTGRCLGHDNRDGFLDVVLEQFAQYLGEPVPQVHGANREVRFRGMVEEVGRRCAASGERALLVVDGLDEDSGVANTSAVHSIAALLPVDAPGIRVVLSTRPA